MGTLDFTQQNGNDSRLETRSFILTIILILE